MRAPRERHGASQQVGPANRLEEHPVLVEHVDLVAQRVGDIDQPVGTQRRARRAHHHPGLEALLPELAEKFPR